MNRIQTFKDYESFHVYGIPNINESNKVLYDLLKPLSQVKLHTQDFHLEYLK